MRVPAHDWADILDDPSPLRLSAVPSIALCAAAPPTAPAVVVTGSRWLPAPSAEHDRHVRENVATEDRHLVAPASQLTSPTKAAATRGRRIVPGTSAHEDVLCDVI